MTQRSIQQLSRPPNPTLCTPRYAWANRRSPVLYVGIVAAALYGTRQAGEAQAVSRY